MQDCKRLLPIIPHLRRSLGEFNITTDRNGDDQAKVVLNHDFPLKWRHGSSTDTPGGDESTQEGPCVLGCE